MYHKVRSNVCTARYLEYKYLVVQTLPPPFLANYLYISILIILFWPQKSSILVVCTRQRRQYFWATLLGGCGPVTWISMRNHIDTTPSHKSNDSLNCSLSSIFSFGSGQYSPFTPPVGLSGDLPIFPNYSSHVTHSVGIPTSERWSPGVVISRRQSLPRWSPGVVINRQQFLNTRRSPGVVMRRSHDLDGNNIFHAVPSSTFNSPGINDFSIVREAAALHSSDSELEIERNTNRR